MYQRNEVIWKDYPEDHKGDYERSDGIPGYAWMARYTLHFLDGYLKNDPAALAYLKKTPAENGVPPHLITVNFRPAKGIAPSFEALRTEVGVQGFDHATEIYTSMKKASPDFTRKENTLLGWADHLSDDHHLPEAIAVLRLDIQLYPDSTDGYDALGQNYSLSGQKQLAIESYRKALEKNPNDDDAKQKLKELESVRPSGS
jgi:tetratricopeptide (TPR) repeat protein